VDEEELYSWGVEIKKDLVQMYNNNLVSYDKWFQYYLRSGEMPYGVAKARTEDPIEWVIDMLEQDYEQILKKLNVEDLEELYGEEE